MASSLRDRLKRIRDASTADPGGRVESCRSATRDPALPGWERVAPCLHRRESESAVEFPERLDISPFLLRRLLPRRLEPLPEPLFVERERLRFVDTETTGLSTGAGTLAFAFAEGRFTDGRFLIRQWFLSDFSGERAMLGEVDRALGGSAVMVSYNGSVFDSAVLRSRFVLNGLSYPEPPQLDLLRTARRLWSSQAGGASLPLMEAFVLRRPRLGDVDGSEAPDRYREWLSGASFERIEPVLEHHLKDVAALPRLLGAADAILRDPEGAGGPMDLLRTALILHRMGRPHWEAVFRRAVAGRDGRATAVFASILSRQRRYDEALELWLSLGDDPGALLAASKILEHRKRDYRAALALVEKGLDRGLDMEARRRRLRKKLGNPNL